MLFSAAMKLLRLTACLVCLGGASSVAAERLTLDHVAKIVNVSNPRMSPDGKRVVIAVSRANLKDNRFDTQLVLVNVATRTQKILTRRQASRHQWSRDGTRLAFIAPAEENKPQLWILPMDGGEASQVTKSPTGVEDFAWRPDSTMLVYSARDEAPQREGEEKANRSFEADGNYADRSADRESSLARASRRWRQHAIDVRTMVGRGHDVWSPDGSTIAVNSQPGAGPEYWQEQSSRIIESPGPCVVAVKKSGLESSNGFSPDGQHYAYTWARNGDSRFVNETWIISSGGGAARNLTECTRRQCVISVGA